MSCNEFHRQCIRHAKTRAVVCLMNTIKFLCILYTTYRLSTRVDPPLAILGDAVASFLQDPDTHTKKMCIISQDAITNNIDAWRRPTAQEWQPSRLPWSAPTDVAEKHRHLVQPLKWVLAMSKDSCRTVFTELLKTRWASAASGRRWCSTLAL